VPKHTVDINFELELHSTMRNHLLQGKKVYNVNNIEILGACKTMAILKMNVCNSLCSYFDKNGQSNND